MACLPLDDLNGPAGANRGLADAQNLDCVHERGQRLAQFVGNRTNGDLQAQPLALVFTLTGRLGRGQPRVVAPACRIAGQ